MGSSDLLCSLAAASKPTTCLVHGQCLWKLLPQILPHHQPRGAQIPLAETKGSWLVLIQTRTLRSAGAEAARAPARGWEHSRCSGICLSKEVVLFSFLSSLQRESLG